ncbi:hypothetical protein BJ912DRAFT_544816 [Pholiota molesta]|nr:hypothetical protein BJ912DRAFT_544816 [Pholiota molesta]
MSSVPVVISERFLRTERLRHLVLSKCNPNWTSHPSFLRSLTHLTLYQLTLESRPTGKQFMDALKAMPDLQALDIKDSLPVEQTWVTDQIHFASLRVLSIHSLYTEVENFFRCVTFPPTAKVIVECTLVGLSSTADADFAGIITNVSRSYSNVTSDTAFHTLLYLPFTFTPTALGSSYSESRGRRKIVDYKSVAGDLELAFGFPAQPPEQLITKLMTRIFSGSLPLQHVIMHTELIWAEIDISEAAKTIVNTLGKLPQMRSFIAGRYTSVLLLKALRFAWQIGSTDPMENLCFPNLSMLCFHGSKFANLALSNSSQDSRIISVESLKECLIQRSKYGTKLKNLTLEFCRNFGEREAHSLSHFVDVIDWDQREAYGDSEDDDDEEEDYEAEEIYSDYDDNDLLSDL